MTEERWRPVVELPADMAVSLGELLHEEGDPLPWCTAKAARLLAAGRSRQRKRLARCLAEYVTLFRRQRSLADAAVFFAPGFTKLPPWSTATVKALSAESGQGALTVAGLREFFEQPTDHPGGPAELTEVEVPAGAALRVYRAQSKEARDRAGGELLWYIWPAGSAPVISIATRWLESAYSREGIKVADDMARNVRLERVTAAQR